ncbi:hypothetical protein CCYA_CCYA12G3243 [Cyanidiococcus yangmingshanensis]|nr:hypothetical protein CCYA_CCYA12G3243 [Cyanidiococcus yangmingshanensis]
MRAESASTLVLWFGASALTLSRAEIGETTSLARWRARLCALTGIAPDLQYLCWVSWCSDLEPPLRVGPEMRADGGLPVEEALPALVALAEARAELLGPARGSSRSCLLLLRRDESSAKSLAFMMRVLQQWQQARCLDERAVEQVRASGVVPVARLEQAAEDHLSSIVRSELRDEAASGDAAEISGAFPITEICLTAAVVVEALRWFKREHFQWVHRPACERCGEEAVRLVGLDAPTELEAVHAAGRVEVYECSPSERGCGQLLRFPRYNDAVYLLTQGRRGRCGEWAQAFALALRVCSVPRVRLVFDFEDHIWTEFWSESSEMWIHADPCEEVLHEPLLYSRGWGKALSWVIAVEVGRDACYLEDRSRVYIPSEDWPSMKQRQERVTGDISVATGLLRLLSALSGGEFHEATHATVVEPPEASASGSGRQTSLRPRQSGALEWIASRGENGPAPTNP